MAEYIYEDHDAFDWPEEVFDEDGQLNTDALMALLQENPSLYAQFQEMYGDELADVGDYNTLMSTVPHTFAETLRYCAVPTLESAMTSLLPLIAVCVICKIISRKVDTLPAAVHCCIATLGMWLLQRFFAYNCLILVLYSCYACLLLTSQSLRGKTGVVLALSSLLVVLLCEIIVPAERWHNVRGAQMVLSMKVISLGFDLDNEEVKEPRVSEILSYLLHPGTVIFGPWISFQYHMDGTEYLKKWLDVAWLKALAISATRACLSLVWSSCIGSWLITPGAWGKWVDAYREALSFRTSHYFVCYLSELTCILSGVSVYGPSGYLREQVVVSRPLNVEIPRSLVEVVTSWNLPMHNWLKKYVFHLAKRRYGALAAVLLTYVASSLLHGLNFQLAAVLLSLGVYSYVEHSLRRKLADGFKSCIEAKPCRATCQHVHKRGHPITLIFNIAFVALAMFHLAYLGVMFDTSPTEQDKGYSMWHTLRKWSQLDFASLLVALATYVFYWFIR